MIAAGIAEALFYRWRERLQLTTYDVKLAYVRVVDANDDGVDATLRSHHGHFDFTVVVQWTDDFECLQSLIVHELLHIWLHLKGWLIEALHEQVPVLLAAVEDQIEHACRQMTRFTLTHTLFDDDDLKVEAEKRL